MGCLRRLEEGTRDKTCARRVARKIKRHFPRAPPHAREKECERKIDASFFLFSFFTLLHLYLFCPLRLTRARLAPERGCPHLARALPPSGYHVLVSHQRGGALILHVSHPVAVTLRSPQVRERERERCARGEAVFHMIGSMPSHLPRASLYTLGNAVTKK